MIASFARLFASALLVILMLSSAMAEEVIRSFDSLVQVQKDGSFIVSETIVVKAEGRKIKRGIYRDFPLNFEDADGNIRKAGFELISVTRDHKPDNSRVEKQGNGLRIYIGRKNHFLSPGVYTYIIKYKTTRQMRYFENHDEVYWNATGNFWDFPIQKVLAQIVLPEGGVATDWDVFTGRIGSTEKDATIGKIAGKRVIKYRTTRTLQAGEGMTVLAKMPKGVVNPPSDAQKRAWFWQDNLAIIIGTLVLIFISLYYFLMWWRIGRDIPQGVIVPRWKAPEGVSPALVNYIDQKGLSGKGFDAISSAILSLAVKGLVKVSKPQDGDVTIEVTGKSTDSQLPIGEASVLSALSNTSDNLLALNTIYGEKIKKLQSNFASAMEKEHRDKFYRHNYGWVVLGIILSVLGLIASLVSADLSEDAWGGLFAAGIFTVVFSSIVLGIGKKLLSAGNLFGKIFTLAIMGVMTFSFLSVGFQMLDSIFDFIKGQQAIFTFVIGILVLNVVFFFLLGAPTSLGRKRMDEIEGLKTYLTLAEKDRMNMADVPDFSTEHYEELLPYAVALGVEKPWSNSFEIWLAAAVAAGAVAATYSPGWYGGRNFGSDSISDTMGDLSSSMQSDFSSSMPVPKSSSSGFSGGGSSGGGGGGGGGGGW